MNAWEFFEVCINAFQAFLIVYFVRQRFHMIRPQLRYAIIAAGMIWVFLSLYIFFTVSIIDTFVFLIPLGYTFLCSDDKWYVKVFWNAALATVFIGLINLMINLFLQLSDASWDHLMSETSLRVAFVVSNNVALLIAVFLMTRVGKQRMDAMLWTSLFLFLLMLIMDLTVIELLYTIRTHLNADDISFTTASICVLFSAVFSLALYEIMSASAYKQKTIEAELEKTRLEQNHYQEMKDMYSYLSSYQHDLNHQLNLIKTLLTDGQTEAGVALYERISFPCEKSHYVFITGNIAMDALLTIKKLMMDKHSIRFEYQPYPLDVLPIDESNFCVVLSNILDNAIEATLRIEGDAPEHVIKLKFARSWDVFFITCENDIQHQSIHMHGSRYLSSKKEGRHGFGIENVKKIVNAADGQCKFTMRENTFYVEITLPFSKPR